MYVYSVVMETKTPNEYGDHEFINEYYVHESKFTNKEFEEICKTALSKCQHNDLFDLEENLKRYYGFKILDVISSYEFKE